ncbi:MAG TPA: amidohydrolase [Candidatus Limnocylindrales bacterium]|nr:amidohydrolase [Candidatus Limnocylindrales bacterium]
MSLFADHLLVNGRIVTLDDAMLRASALAIRAGWIVGVGSADELSSLRGPQTQVIDLQCATVLPGLVDAHIHWQRYSESLAAVNLFQVPSKAEALEHVRERAATVAPGRWITGFGWAQDIWPDPRFPCASDLDAVAPQHPVFLRGRSGHVAWANSLALRMAGIDRDTQAPEGSDILKGDNGAPTGILLEWDAMALVERVIPAPTIEEIADGMLAAEKSAYAMGMTGLHDFDDQDAFAAFQRLRERDQLGLRVLKNINLKYLDSVLDLGLRWGFGDAWLRVGGVKLFADGALGAHTALMTAPYEGEPDNRGMVVVPKEAMAEAVLRATAAGLPATIHAIGDRAVHDVLDVYALARQREAELGIPRAARRHRVEHVQLIHPQDVGRLAELDVIASMQPIHATSDYPVADKLWGAARAPFSYNPRLQLDRGVTVAFGSDAPFDMPGPLAGIHAAVTRQRADGSPGPLGWTPAARVTLEEAIRAYTTAPAYAAGRESELGRLRVGYRADLVVIDGDYLAANGEALLAARVRGTMVDGLWRYEDWF